MFRYRAGLVVVGAGIVLIVTGFIATPGAPPPELTTPEITPSPATVDPTPPPTSAATPTAAPDQTITPAPTITPTPTVLARPTPTATGPGPEPGPTDLAITVGESLLAPTDEPERHADFVASWIVDSSSLSTTAAALFDITVDGSEEIRSVVVTIEAVLIDGEWSVANVRAS